MPMDGPRIAFRVAGSPAIGGGHVVRSVSIADALAASGAACTFFTTAEAVAAAPLLSRSGHQLVTVPDQADTVMAAAKPHAPFDWLVTDDYSLGAAQETPWRSLARRILAVDDLANRVHDCDLLLDSAPTRRFEDYAALVPAGAQMLLGERYAPLRAEFSGHRAKALARRNEAIRPSRLLVSFGLVDPGGITAQAVAAIHQAMPDMAMDVVLGPQASSREQVAQLAQAAGNISLHVDPRSMPALMIACDLALGAGGSTAWERACLGLPTVAVILADNQHNFAHELAARGILFAVEKTPDLWNQVVQHLSRLADDDSQWHRMSAVAAEACDGLGATRIAQAMLAS
jgi:UDP-2,4-diacetamido-2,4,6-trideoxy-beta-L-altropyranose hydrolase